MPIKKLLPPLPALLALLSLAAISFAAAPRPLRTISYQGIYTDRAGNAQPDLEYTVKFSLYGDSIASMPIWSESKILKTTSGLFGTNLGDVSPLAVSFDKAYWLGVTFDKNPELMPRVRLSSAGSAVRADTAGFALYTVKAVFADSARIAGSAVTAGFATKAGFADSATSSFRADTAKFARVSGPASTAKFADSSKAALKADSATGAMRAGTALTAGSANTAALATKAGFADSTKASFKADTAIGSLRAVTALTAGFATNATNAIEAKHTINADNALNATNAVTAQKVVATGKGVTADTIITNTVQAKTAGNLNLISQSGKGIVVDPSGCVNIDKILTIQNKTNTGFNYLNIFDSLGVLFSVNKRGVNSDKTLITDIGVNLAFDGGDGNTAYAVNGTKYAPRIQLNAENGSIAFFGDDKANQKESWRPFNNAIKTMEINSNGNVAVAGTLTAANFPSPSDRRFKTDITPLSNSLQKVTQLQGVSYNWNRTAFPDRGFSTDHQIGVIAQDVEKIIPEVVHTGSDGYKSVEYDKLTSVLIEAIKEQQKQITIQQGQIADLKKEVDALSGSKR